MRLCRKPGVLGGGVIEGQALSHSAALQLAEVAGAQAGAKQAMMRWSVRLPVFPRITPPPCQLRAGDGRASPPPRPCRLTVSARKHTSAGGFWRFEPSRNCRSRRRPCYDVHVRESNLSHVVGKHGAGLSQHTQGYLVEILLFGLLVAFEIWSKHERITCFALCLR